MTHDSVIAPQALVEALKYYAQATTKAWDQAAMGFVDAAQFDCTLKDHKTSWVSIGLTANGFYGRSVEVPVMELAQKLEHLGFTCHIADAKKAEGTDNRDTQTIKVIVPLTVSCLQKLYQGITDAKVAQTNDTAQRKLKSVVDDVYRSRDEIGTQLAQLDALLKRHDRGGLRLDGRVQRPRSMRLPCKIHCSRWWRPCK